MRLAALEQQQHGRNGADDAAAHEQWHTKQQIQCDGAADDFGEVGGDGDNLGLHEEQEAPGGAHALP